MKRLVIALLAALPAGAYACGQQGPMGMMGHGMPGPHPGGPGMLLGAGFYGILAALGYWVLQHAAKETENCVKRAGKTVAWVLIVFGLLGLLCGVMGHIKANCQCKAKCEMQEAGGGGQAGGPAEPQTIQVQVKTVKGEAKKK